MKDIYFYYDILSPYSYQAWCLLREKYEHLSNLAEKIHFLPVMMSQVIKSHDTKGPAEIASKRDYLMKECLRFAQKNNLEFSIPKKLPFNNLFGLRLCLIEKNQFEIVNGVFEYIWKDSLDGEDESGLLNYLSERGIDTIGLEDFAYSKEARQKLKENTKDAIAQKLFGVPTFLVKDDNSHELFWGRDSIEDLVNFLENKDQFDQNKYQQYLKLFENNI